VGELGELRTHLRRLLERHWTVQQRLAFASGDKAQSLRVVDVLEREIGINAVLVPEEFGGSGAGCREVVVVAEEIGAALVPSNILGSSMASYVLQQASGIAAGQVLQKAVHRRARSVFVWPGADALWAEPPPASIDKGRLRSKCSRVPDIEDGALLLVPAIEEGTVGLAALESGPESAGVTITTFPSPDVFRMLGDVQIDDATAEFFPVPSAEQVWIGALVLGSLVLAAECVGAGMECVQRVVDYGQDRVQFGRPIATFQAVKHRVADALIELEAARALTYRAAASFPGPSAGPPGPDVIDLARMAKAAASDALHQAALECIQLHGAIAFTWDHPAHLYLKRWATSSCLYGQAEDLRHLVYESAVGQPHISERGSNVIN
jgi:alkylation response protein AidB-like acyl-CoA dehydrogenase